MNKEVRVRKMQVLLEKFSKMQGEPIKGVHTTVKSIGFSSYTVPALVDMQVLQKIGHGVYMSLITTDKITDKLINKVLDRALVLSKSGATKLKSPPRVVEVEVKLNPLDTVSDDDLVAELKRRGYVGSLIKSYDIVESKIPQDEGTGESVLA